MAALKKTPRKKLSPLGKVLSRSFKSLGIESNFAKQKLLNSWEEVVGKQISSISQPEYFKFRTLFVNVCDSNWIHQLVFLEDNIKEKINQFIGKKLVQKIYFKVGEFPERETKKTISNKGGFINFIDLINANDKMEVEHVIDTLKDPELKNILMRIMMKGRGAYKFRHGQKKENRCSSWHK